MSEESPKLEDLPKVDPSLKSELTTFAASQLKHAETQEKVVLPTKEGECLWLEVPTLGFIAPAVLSSLHT